MESQDLESELELSLSQLQNQLLQPSQPLHPHGKARPAKKGKGLYIDQLSYFNLQEDARALVILLQVDSMECGGKKVIFQGYFQGLNSD